MRYPPELLDRVVDAMDRAQEYYARIDTSGLTGKFVYSVGYFGQDGEYVVLIECETREDSINARDTLEGRARAAAALVAVDYQVGV